MKEKTDAFDRIVDFLQYWSQSFATSDEHIIVEKSYENGVHDGKIMFARKLLDLIQNEMKEKE